MTLGEEHMALVHADGSKCPDGCDEKGHPDDVAHYQGKSWLDLYYSLGKEATAVNEMANGAFTPNEMQDYLDERDMWQERADRAYAKAMEEDPTLESIWE